MTDRSRRHADRTETVVMAIGGMVRAAVGSRSRRDKPQKAVLRAGSIKGVEMTERQRNLDHQRKERDPGNAFDIRPNPGHAEASRVERSQDQALIDVAASFAKLDERCQRQCTQVPQNSAICEILATPHDVGGG